MEIPNSRSLARYLATILLFVHVQAYPASARLGVFEVASVSSSNAIANALSGGLGTPGFSISPDGRFVAFVSGGTNLSPEAVGGIFLRDTCRGGGQFCTPFTGNTQTLTVVSSNPGIFTTNQAGTGQGAIQIANTASLAAPSGAFPNSRPANRGEFIPIFCTSLGPVNNVPNSGFITNDASSTLISPVTVTIGGLQADVSFAGLAPGFVGLYQVNAQGTCQCAGW